MRGGTLRGNCNVCGQSWDNLVATNVPGFSCGEHDYGENKGEWFGIPNIHTEADVLSTHGPGASITNAVCTPC